MWVMTQRLSGGEVSLMAEEYDRLAEELARLYTVACKRIGWYSDGYRAWVERQIINNDVVYLVWRDSTKPYGIDYELWKDERPTTGSYQTGVVHCASLDRARAIAKMFGTPDDRRPI